jgi:hypothetical protein
MNSRRRLGLPLLLRFRRAETITFRRVTPLVHHSKFGGQCLRWVSSARRDPAVASTHVRFAPKADKKQIISVCPLRAKSVRTQRSKDSALFDHLVGAPRRGGGVTSRGPRRRHVRFAPIATEFMLSCEPTLSATSGPPRDPIQ